jgi:hypothetical protein
MLSTLFTVVGAAVKPPSRPGTAASAAASPSCPRALDQRRLLAADQRRHRDAR